MNTVSRHSNLRKTSMTIMLWMLLLFVSVNTIQGSAPQSSLSAPMAMANDSNVISGTDINGNGTNEDELPEDINELLASLSLLPTRPDTLPAYTLGGQRMDGRKRNANARTLYIYNIVIKNGRKIVKRDR